MIKFFRKIRQKLLSENKFSKYLIYAVGEIVLVVIGILIALQINNLNQDKINRNYEITMLSQIKGTLIDDIKNLEGGLRSLDKTKKSLRKLAIIRNEPTFPQDSLNYYFALLRKSGIGVSINYSAYESIKSTGFDKISNKSLRNSITNLYEVKLKGVEFWINDFIKRKSEIKGDLINKTFNKKITPDSTNGIKIEYLVNYELMHNNKEFNDILAITGGYIPIANRNLNYAIRVMSEEVQEIDKELKK